MSLIKVSTNIGELTNSDRFKNHIENVTNALNDATIVAPTSKISLEDEPEYKLILESNQIVQEIDEEIVATHRYVCDIYNKKFPELESMIPNRIDYTRTILRIGNEMDMTLVDLNDILPSNVVMIVSVSASTTPGVPLTDEELKECFRGCEEVVKLDSDRAFLLQYIESRMSKIAPNLCELIGAHLAALLVGLAGGLVPLSKIPSCNIQVMGQEKKNLAGLSLSSAMPHTGVINFCEIVQSCPPYLRKKALKVLAGKVALCARIDSYQTDFNGVEGRKMKAEIEEKFEKFQEAPKARTKKALPIPEEKKRSKRGGKRVRKMKDRYMVTELQKQQNKMSFSTGGGEYGDSAMGLDLGMIGSKDTGKVRSAAIKDSKFLKKQKKVMSVASSGSSNGLSSSLAFDGAGAGLELINPNAAADRVKEANKKWFNNQSGFLSAAPK